MNELISVREYAAIKGCSLNAVYKRVKTSLKPYVVEVEGIKYLKAEILEKEGLKTVKTVDVKTVENVFNEVKTEENAARPEEPREKINSDAIIVETIRILQEQLIKKDQELAKKDQEIERLTLKLDAAAAHEREINDKLTVLLEQSQQLNSNNQYLIAAAQTEKTENSEEKAAVVPAAIVEVEEPVNKPWWVRLFG